MRQPNEGASHNAADAAPPTQTNANYVHRWLASISGRSQLRKTWDMIEANRLPAYKAAEKAE